MIPENEKFIEAKILTYMHRGLINNIEYLRKYLLDKPQKDVLDVGCGGGVTPLFLDIPYVGAEIFLRQLEMVKADSPQLYVFCANSAELPIKPGQFSHFICNSVLEHIADVKKTLKEINRVVEAGGLIKVPCRDRIPFFLDPINSIRLKMKKKPLRFGVFDFGNISFYTLDEWRNLILECGFDIEEEFDEDYTFLMQIMGFFLFIIFRNRDYNDLPVTKKVRFSLAKKVISFYNVLRWFDFRTPHSLQRVFIVKKREDVSHE